VAEVSARAAQDAASRPTAKVMLFPNFFQAYVPVPVHPLAFSRANVIVVAVAEYEPRASAKPFCFTV
jgi:hypothetical protein